MSFQLLKPKITQQKYHAKNIISRKEEDSAGTQPITSYRLKDVERTSLFTSFRASIVAEAAMALPLFFFAVCCLCYMLEIMAVQMNVRAAAHSVGKEIVKEIYAVPYVLPSKVETDIVETIGAERLNRSIVKGGSSGLDCSRTRVSAMNGILYMEVEYEVALPISVFGRLTMDCTEKFQMKGWTGYVRGGFLPNREDVVYITETGLVYHRDYHCTYLDLSVQMAAKSDIANLRNESGGKYYPCILCGGGQGSYVYITSQGSRYHSSLSCSGLKRKVYAVPLSETMGKGACSRCGY